MRFSQVFLCGLAVDAHLGRIRVGVGLYARGVRMPALWDNDMLKGGGGIGRTKTSCVRDWSHFSAAFTRIGTRVVLARAVERLVVRGALVVITRCVVPVTTIISSVQAPRIVGTKYYRAVLPATMLVRFSGHCMHTW